MTEKERPIERVTIISNGQERQISAPKGHNLLNVLRREGISLPASCGGQGICGKCKVKAKGALSAPSSNERLLLSGEQDERLACYATIEGDVIVYVDDRLSLSIESAWDPPISVSTPFFESGVGAAIDIGTTTICVYLYEKNGDLLASLSERNRQADYGADIMTRIAFDMKDDSQTLHLILTEQLSDLLMRACQKATISTRDVSAIVIAGNTTMLHFLEGLKTESIARAPYTPLSLFGTFTHLSIPSFEKITAYLPPAISAYVGSDITAGLLYAGITEKNENVLLLDVGTNGEMVLKANDRLISCSTAAGPAFEGSGIEMGSGAIPGAISEVKVQDQSIAFTTIAHAKAQSLCGSGLLDLTAAALELGWIDQKGQITVGEKIVIPHTNVYLSQKDVRQLQLAKGAIRAGIDTILHHAGISQNEIETIYLAGGFGTKLDPYSAEKIGLIPHGLAGRVKALGDASAAGASSLLLNRELVEEVKVLATETKTIELSADRFFMQRFVRALNFDL